MHKSLHLTEMFCPESTTVYFLISFVFLSIVRLDYEQKIMVIREKPFDSVHLLLRVALYETHKMYKLTACEVDYKKQ